MGLLFLQLIDTRKQIAESLGLSVPAYLSKIRAEFPAHIRAMIGHKGGFMSSFIGGFMAYLLLLLWSFSAYGDLDGPEAINKATLR